ncbi:hypothetical protein GJV84_12130 [Citrobacter freundii]|nr:hypothetical protein GJV84_12130 [Citrobacter freundii]HAT2338055.1 hypothetical protein [Citrobacter freundii]HAT2362515.1 hypothetical protein [Citrobacter freundii]HAU8240110.1 hypothetical protein [Citrobacter freundii]
MDTETCLPLLYPLRYHIDHLAFRSLSTQSASLQAVKFFYEFWLAERRKAASLVPLQPISTALTAAPSSSSIATPLEIVKRIGQLAVTEHMTLDNTIKANLHTFDDRDDVARFVEASFADGFFEDVAAAFEEIRDAEGPEQASAMVARHAVLYPLKFGSCMREVNLWGCPYRLKCQSAAFCEHFTLTGRIDELPHE